MDSVSKLQGANTIKQLAGLDHLHSLTTMHLRENQLVELDGFSEEMKMLQYVNIRWVVRISFQNSITHPIDFYESKAINNLKWSIYYMHKTLATTII